MGVSGGNGVVRKGTTRNASLHLHVLALDDVHMT